jgi:hypothetical protein
MASQINTRELKGARIGLPQAEQTFQSRGLARAVGTEKTEDLSPRDREANSAHRLPLTVAFPQITNRHRGFHRSVRRRLGLFQIGRGINQQAGP